MASTPSHPLAILVVDDEPNIRRLLQLSLTRDDRRVDTAATPDEARLRIRSHSYDLALVDLRLGTASGLDLIPQLLSQSPWTKVIVITAFSSIDTAVEAMRRGAFDYLPKPFTPAELEAVVEKAAARRLPDAAAGSTESRSPAMSQALTLVRQVAARDATVLLRGESGTGKSVLARTIHQASPRADKPFATVSCPSLSAELLESELFGHVRGSFTGAGRDHVGRIEAAAGGTLFLDEIGDLPQRLQPKLLRFLQEREYERVGDTATRRADVRVIAATNADLGAAIAAKTFREDLYYRLNVVQITVPPLRERREDILPLAVQMLQAVTADHPMSIGPDAADALVKYGWPGNLRELHNAVERAAVIADGPTLRRHHLPPAVTAAVAADAALPSSTLPTLDAVEEAHIRHVLAATPSLEDAAKVLGINTATLWRRRKRYGL